MLSRLSPCAPSASYLPPASSSPWLGDGAVGIQLAHVAAYVEQHDPLGRVYDVVHGAAMSHDRSGIVDGDERPTVPTLPPAILDQIRERGSPAGDVVWCGGSDLHPLTVSGDRSTGP